LWFARLKQLADMFDLLGRGLFCGWFAESEDKSKATIYNQYQSYGNDPLKKELPVMDDTLPEEDKQRQKDADRLEPAMTHKEAENQETGAGEDCAAEHEYPGLRIAARLKKCRQEQPAAEPYQSEDSVAEGRFKLDVQGAFAKRDVPEDDDDDEVSDYEKRQCASTAFRTRTGDRGSAQHNRPPFM
jgi:hypothetical protein